MELGHHIQKAIEVLKAFPDLDDEEIMKKLSSSGIDEMLSADLVNFITMAFCRAMLNSSGVQFQDHYLIMNAKNKFSEPQKLNNEPIFVEAFKIAESEVLEGNVDDSYLSIAQRDAEFRVINDAANNGSELKNLIMSPTIIFKEDFTYTTTNAENNSEKKWWQFWR